MRNVPSISSCFLNSCLPFKAAMRTFLHSLQTRQTLAHSVCARNYFCNQPFSLRLMKGDKLIIFVKAPRPGLVKTRLAKALGPESACAAYRQLAEILFKRLSP